MSVNNLQDKRETLFTMNCSILSIKCFSNDENLKNLGYGSIDGTGLVD